MKPSTLASLCDEAYREYFLSRDSCIRVCRTILQEVNNERTSLGAQVEYLLSQARAIGAMPFLAQGVLPGHIVNDVMSVLESALPRMIKGEIPLSGLMQVLREKLGPFWWERLMVEAPMGTYAKLCAEFLESRQRFSGSILELGAGVGNLSRLLQGRVGRFIRTDIQPAFLNRRYADEESVYDFNAPGPWRDLDTIVAVNCLHCAGDKRVAIANAMAMLAPGGLLVLAEGSPYVQPNEPWALNILFGLFDGWWDQGGFIARAKWLETFEQCGFTAIGSVPLTSAGFDFGGLVFGEKPRV